MRFIVLFLLFYSGLVNAGEPGLCSNDVDEVRDYICDSRNSSNSQLEKDLNEDCIPAAYRSVDTFIEERATYTDKDDEGCKYNAQDMALAVIDSVNQENEIKKTNKIISNSEKDCNETGCRQLNYVKTITSVIPVFGIYGAISEHIQDSIRNQMAPMLPSRTVDEQHCKNCLSKNISNFNIESNENDNGLKELNDYIYEGMRKSVANRYMLFLEDHKLTDSDIDPNSCMSASKVNPFLNEHEKNQVSKMNSNQKVDIHQCDNGKVITLKNYKDLSIEFNTKTKGHIDDVINLLSYFEGVNLSSELSRKIFNKSEMVRADELLYLAADKSYIESLDLESMDLSDRDEKSFLKFRAAAQKVYGKVNKPGDIISLVNTAVNEDPNFKYLLSGPVKYVMKSKKKGNIHNLYESINLKNNIKKISTPLKMSIETYCKQLRLDLERLNKLKKAKERDGIISERSGSYELEPLFKDKKVNQILSLAIDTYQEKNKSLNGLSYEKLGKLKCKSGESYIHSPANSYPFHSGLEFPSSEALTLSKIDDQKKRFFLNNYCEKPEYYHRNATRISRFNKTWDQTNCSSGECNTETYKKREAKDTFQNSLNKPTVSSSESLQRQRNSISSDSSKMLQDVSNISGVSRLNSLGELSRKERVSNLNPGSTSKSTEGNFKRNSTKSTREKLDENISNLEKENKLLRQNHALKDKLASLERSKGNNLNSQKSVGTSLRAPASRSGINAVNSQSRDFINQSTSNIAGYAKANVSKEAFNKNLANIKGNIREDKLNGVVSLVVDPSINPDSSLEQIYEKLKDYDLAIIKEALDAKMPVKFIDNKGTVFKIIEVDTDEYDLLMKRFSKVSLVVKKEKPLSNTRLEYLNLIKASEELTQN